MVTLKLLNIFIYILLPDFMHKTHNLDKDEVYNLLKGISYGKKKKKV